MRNQAKGNISQSVFSTDCKPPAVTLTTEHKIGAEMLRYYRCASVFKRGACLNVAHSHIRVTGCAKEWCPDCGKKNSYFHNRKKNRIFAKVHSMAKVSYLVVTVPGELRPRMDKQALHDMRYYLTRKLKRTNIEGRSEVTYKTEIKTYVSKKTGEITRREYKRAVYTGYDQGFSRWHWAGDCYHCKNSKVKGCEMCEYTGAGREWKPHLNFLINERWMEEKQLDAFKSDVAAWFKMYFKLDYTPKKGAWLKYCKDEKARNHKINYITRATWRFYDFEKCNIIRGQRMATWGEFEVKQQPTTETALLERGICSHCLKQTGEIVKIQWEPGILSRGEVLRVLYQYREVDHSADIFGNVNKKNAQGGHFYTELDILRILDG